MQRDVEDVVQSRSSHPQQERAVEGDAEGDGSERPSEARGARVQTAPSRAAARCVLQPEGTKRATSVNIQLPCLQKDLRTGSISRDTVNFPSELCRLRGMFTEFARLVTPQGCRLQVAGCRLQVPVAVACCTRHAACAGAGAGACLTCELPNHRDQQTVATTAVTTGT